MDGLTAHSAETVGVALSADRERAARDERRQHYAWRKRVGSRLPDLAARTFALRGRAYHGSLYHHGLEAQLGEVIKIASTIGDRPDCQDQLVDQVIVEGFFRDLKRAETSALAEAAARAASGS
ncbi:hypothetical protein [Sphingosinicella sp. BN140058]|uniref:hypothetical protein n=1 Tax=Sphingosinicella sp. BN140058 TaxID=1892855 RepID=UPI0010136468|nr:hypothetical protein [Sphingosinicella sp. BN140058]QAY80446.1 hypothetical protein ETR14_27795 [Sphingosinicella sp. BN140058]